MSRSGRPGGECMAAGRALAELSEVRNRESSRKTSQKEPCKEPARTPARNPARTPCTSWGVNKPPDEKPGGDSPPPQVHGRSFRRFRKLNSRPRPCPISAVLWSRPHGACDQHRRVGKAITSPIAGTTGARPEPGPARSATSGRQMHGEWHIHTPPLQGRVAGIQKHGVTVSMSNVCHRHRCRREAGARPPVQGGRQ
eukprot:scaffold5552_cov52-Phaeocystis_antarctica.AAC.1